MPKTAINYSSTILYKLCCKDLNIKDLYVGHTTNFTKRKQNHKGRCINENDKKYTLKVYQFIRDNGGWDNWEMIEIEKCSLNDENEAKARERYWIEFLNCTLNSYIPLRSKKEYQQIHKEKLSDYISEYRIKKKDEITQNTSEYRIKNKEKLKEYFSKPCTCEVCGRTYTQGHKSRHIKTKYHMACIQN